MSWKENRMIKFKVGKLRRNGDFSIIHARQDFDVIVEAHNTLVDALKVAYGEINRLSKEIEQLKGGAE